MLFSNLTINKKHGYNDEINMFVVYRPCESDSGKYLKNTTPTTVGNIKQIATITNSHRRALYLL